MTGASQPGAATDDGWRALIQRGRAPRFALIVLGTWLTAAETLMTATVMPSVAADIGGFAWFGWAAALYFTGAILAGATSGRLSIRLGLRQAMVLGGVTYALGCAACATAPTIGLFLAGRLLQGVGGGWVVGLCFVAVTALFPQGLWSRVFSGLAGVWGAATLISPLIGGLFAQAGFWRGAFWLFAAQGAGLIVAVLILIPPRAGAGPTTAARPPLAALSALAAAILAIGAAGLVERVGLSIILGVVGCALLILFFGLNAKAEAPLLPRLAADPKSGVGAGLMVVFGFSAACASLTVYGPALFQALHGASPVLAGYILGGEAFAWTTAALLVAGKAQSGLFIRLGAVLITIAVILLALLIPRAGLAWALVGALVQGAGFGLIWAFTSARIVACAPEPERALASSATPTMQMIGTAVGAAASGVIANLGGFGHGPAAARAGAVGFWLFAAFIPLALAACAAAWRLSQPQFAHPADGAAKSRDMVNTRLTQGAES